MITVTDSLDTSRQGVTSGLEFSINFDYVVLAACKYSVLQPSSPSILPIELSFTETPTPLVIPEVTDAGTAVL